MIFYSTCYSNCNINAVYHNSSNLHSIVGQNNLLFPISMNSLVCFPKRKESRYKWTNLNYVNDTILINETKIPK